MQTATSATLSRRAAAPAAVQVQPENAQYLTFSLGSELFAVGILVIKEIIQFGQLTTVPLMPAHIRGVINLRGAVVPVIDLQARFGRGAAQVGKRTCIVIIEVSHEDERHDIGIMVDAVSAVIDIGADQIEPAPAFGASVRIDFIEGIGKVNDRFVIILDVTRTFSLGELTELNGLDSAVRN
ncbi:MAG: purine-binding chemotaxis protein CheW [Herminiimonas sp.]|nr:purine-binding chemotaxis protein CheW [Herminiimonas sp.]